MTSKKYMIDLLSGCGGLSFGFDQSVFECLIGVDFEQPALDTSSDIHTHAEAFISDLSGDISFDITPK